MNIQAGSQWYYASNAIESSVLWDDWSVENQGGQAALSVRHYVAMQASPRWQLGIESRVDYQLSLSEQAAQFYSRLERNSLPQGLYDLDLQVNAVKSHGFFAQYFIPLSSSLSFSFIAHVYQPVAVQNGHLQGVGEVYADGAFQYQYTLDYRYDQNELLDSVSAGVRGYGQSFDVHFNAHVYRDVVVRVEINDLFYGYQWASANYDEGCISRPANTCRVKSVASGFYQGFAPNYLAELAIDSHDDVSWQLGAVSRWRDNDVYLGLKHSHYAIQYNLVKQSLTFGLGWKRLQFVMATDKLNPQNSKHLQFGFDVNWSLP